MLKSGNSKEGEGMESFQRVIQEVARERERQDAKWGDGHDSEHGLPEWVVIMYAELCEVLSAMGPQYTVTDEARTELVHVAAVAVAALERLGVPEKLEGG